MKKLLEDLKKHKENHPEYEGMYFTLCLDGSGRVYGWGNEIIFEFQDEEEFQEKLKL